jgi:hypothetical protein
VYIRRFGFSQGQISHNRRNRQFCPALESPEATLQVIFKVSCQGRPSNTDAAIRRHSSLSGFPQSWSKTQRSFGSRTVAVTYPSVRPLDRRGLWRLGSFLKSSRAGLSGSRSLCGTTGAWCVELDSQDSCAYCCDSRGRRAPGAPVAFTVNLARERANARERNSYIDRCRESCRPPEYRRSVEPWELRRLRGALRRRPS